MPPSIINEASMQTSVSAITRSMCAFDYGRSAKAVANLLLEGGADADSKGNGYGQAPVLVPFNNADDAGYETNSFPPLRK